MQGKYKVKVITDKSIHKLEKLCNDEGWEVWNVAGCDKQLIYLLRKPV